MFDLPHKVVTLFKVKKSSHDVNVLMYVVVDAGSTGDAGWCCWLLLLSHEWSFQMQREEWDIEQLKQSV